MVTYEASPTSKHATRFGYGFAPNSAHVEKRKTLERRLSEVPPGTNVLPESVRYLTQCERGRDSTTVTRCKKIAVIAFQESLQRVEFLCERDGPKRVALAAIHGKAYSWRRIYVEEPRH